MSAASSITRRDLLAGSGALALGVAGASALAGVARADEAGASQASDASAASWRTAPEPVADADIAQAYDVDVAIVGLGHAGLAAYRELAEQGVNVLVAEKQEKDSWFTLGHDIGHINSKALAKYDVPEVDPVEFVNNWELQAHNKANPALVMKFAKHSGEAVDWYLEAVDADIVDKAHVTHWPDNEHTIHQLNNGLRYYAGTLQWWEDNWNGKGMVNNGEGLEMKDLSRCQLSYVEQNYAANAQVLFGTSAVQLVKDGDAVTGFVAKASDGSYVKVNASKGVILAGGGFGGNAEMCADLLPQIARTFAPGEDFAGMMDRDGSAIQMGVWAGGRLETDISSMNFDSMTIPDYIPGPLWVDGDGERFQNEGFGGPELNGFQLARLHRGKIISVYDSGYADQIIIGFPGHQAFDYADEATVENMKATIAAAQGTGAEGAEGWFCADTLDELADFIGYNADQKATFLATVEHYNELCAAGVDDDFGKDPRFLFAVENGPFYTHVTEPALGFALVTTGGFVTTNDQQVLDENYQPIEGLYATGNNCGMRFGPAYITPIPGVSIGMCITLGRELGTYLAGK
ncbi:MAG: FAD-dependent oxidoreductase [Coriobacteriia bacterium]|nr:FAD-dependent oxidoreductase [Coriobacteriia bacterium]MBS5477142.1 FAD-dependent oxidoreductase [Coriobacteriia bacterium]